MEGCCKLSSVRKYGRRFVLDSTARFKAVVWPCVCQIHNCLSLGRYRGPLLWQKHIFCPTSRFFQGVLCKMMQTMLYHWLCVCFVQSHGCLQVQDSNNFSLFYSLKFIQRRQCRSTGIGGQAKSEAYHWAGLTLKLSLLCSFWKMQQEQD